MSLNNLESLDVIFQWATPSMATYLRRYCNVNEADLGIVAESIQNNGAITIRIGYRCIFLENSIGDMAAALHLGDGISNLSRAVVANQSNHISDLLSNPDNEDAMVYLNTMISIVLLDYIITVRPEYLAAKSSSLINSTIQDELLAEAIERVNRSGIISYHLQVYRMDRPIAMTPSVVRGSYYGLGNITDMNILGILRDQDPLPDSPEIINDLGMTIGTKRILNIDDIIDNHIQTSYDESMDVYLTYYKLIVDGYVPGAITSTYYQYKLLVTSSDEYAGIIDPIPLVRYNAENIHNTLALIIAEYDSIAFPNGISIQSGLLIDLAYIYVKYVRARFSHLPKACQFQIIYRIIIPLMYDRYGCKTYIDYWL